MTTLHARAGRHGRPSRSRAIRMSALDSGSIRSMQHTASCSRSRSVAHEAKDADPIHGCPDRFEVRPPSKGESLHRIARLIDQPFVRSRDPREDRELPASDSTGIGARVDAGRALPRLESACRRSDSCDCDNAWPSAVDNQSQDRPQRWLRILCKPSVSGCLGPGTPISRRLGRSTPINASLIDRPDHHCVKQKKGPDGAPSMQRPGWRRLRSHDHLDPAHSRLQPCAPCPCRSRACAAWLRCLRCPA